MKTCNICRVTLASEAFSLRRASPDGLNYTCRGCSKARCSDWRKDNPEAFKAWYADNREARAGYWQEWYAANREARAASYARWGRANKGTVNALIAKRTAAKKNATPAWADHDKIRAFYTEADRLTRETGIRHEVDHIYPLQSEFVCGLHWEGNLQILTKVENIRKSNKIPTAVT